MVDFSGIGKVTAVDVEKGVVTVSIEGDPLRLKALDFVSKVYVYS